MTDLRDQLADFDAAALRALARRHNRPEPIHLTDRIDIGNTLWRLRYEARMSPDGLAARLGLSRSGISKRECYGRIPASALIQHARALGYDLALIPREDA